MGDSSQEDTLFKLRWERSPRHARPVQENMWPDSGESGRRRGEGQTTFYCVMEISGERRHNPMSLSTTRYPLHQETKKRWGREVNFEKEAIRGTAATNRVKGAVVCMRKEKEEKAVMETAKKVVVMDLGQGN